MFARKEQREFTRAGVILIFALLVFLHLLPLSLHPTRAGNDLMDTLLNTWIVTWVQQHLLEPSQIFNANAFFPYPNTLSYSEHLFPLAVISLPVYLLFGNPLLTYNLLFLLFYFLNGYAMYLLVRHLTGNDPAGIAAGVIFAFNAYLMSHVTHLQLLSSWIIPLAFLCLHRFFRSPRLKDSVLFSVLFTALGLSCIYYGLFFISILAVALPLFFLLYRQEDRPAPFFRLLLPLLPAGVILLVFSFPYQVMMKTFGLERGLTKGADVENYLAPVTSNVLFGKPLKAFGTSEGYLFPGFLALILAAAFLIFHRRLFRNIPLLPRKILFWGIVFSILAQALILGSGGFKLKFLFLHLSGHRFERFAALALFGTLAGFLLSLLIRVLKRSGFEKDEARALYLYIGVLFWALFLSFGSHIFVFKKPLFRSETVQSLVTPFRWFYELVPGFKGIRVPGRYAVFVLFAVAVMAGCGFKALLGLLSGRKARTAFALGLIVLLNLEFLSIPQRTKFIPPAAEIPPTYAWLRGLPAGAAVAEVPFFSQIAHEPIYMYFSLFHKKRIVNGYSGMIPPSTDYIREVFKGFPSWECIDILRVLGVRYVILHTKVWKPEKTNRVLTRIEERFADSLRGIKEFRYAFKRPTDLDRFFGADIIYEVLPAGREARRPSLLRELPVADWTAKALYNGLLLHYLKDGNKETYWSSARTKRPGEYLILEFQGPENVSRIDLRLGSVLTGFGHSFRVETSLDGNVWDTAGGAYSPGEFAEQFIANPRDPVQRIHLGGSPVRFVKITQTGRDVQAQWCVSEASVFIE